MSRVIQGTSGANERKPDDRSDPFGLSGYRFEDH